MRRAGAVTLAAAAVLAAAPAPARAVVPAVPVLAGSPWPEMRHDARNTGASPIRGRYRGDLPWSFRTGRGIFSTPVLGDSQVPVESVETAYVGSADGYFYALGRDGKRLWRFRTGGIIDAAAALGAAGRRGGFPITVGSGDETLYGLREEPQPLGRSERVRWKFRSPVGPATGQLVNWWEGNPAIGPDGNIYVGNTGGGTFSLTPGGEQRWLVQRANSVWTTPAFDEAGNSYWGSVDFFAFSLDPAGGQRWQTFTPGYVTSSPALGSDGTVYVGSFDRALHALDPDTGAERWAFPTAEHVYSSPALAADASGATSAIYFGSADGSVYAVRPDGTELWRYDTGDPVRSSPAIGRAPRGDGLIVYVGSSNGVLYALDAETGKRRWSFDTTPSSNELADRNDLNGSPALGRRGVYIGGEHGRVWFVPYDYCREREFEPRCTTDPGEEFPDEASGMRAVTPGGTTLGRSEKVPPSTVLATRLVVRRAGLSADARIEPGPGSDSLVSSDPPFEFSTELSGDGRFLFIRPDGPLRGDTKYRVRVAGTWADGSQTGGFDTGLRFRTAPARGRNPGLGVHGDRVDALELSRLALPLPSLLPSVNQIGFDSYDLIAGTIARRKTGPHSGRLLLWVVGARRDDRGVAFADPAGGFAFPLAGTYHRDQVALNAAGVSLQFSFGPVPLRSFDFRGGLKSGGAGFRQGASLFGLVTCGDVPNYSVQLRVAGVCNETDTLPAFGTFLSEAYERGPANRRPEGVAHGSLSLTRPTATEDGLVELALDGRGPGAQRHSASVLLVDRDTGLPVPLDYRSLTSPVVDAGGRLAGARLRIPAGTALPDSLRGYAIVDVFPLGHQAL